GRSLLAVGTDFQAHTWELVTGKKLTARPLRVGALAGLPTNELQRELFLRDVEMWGRLASSPDGKLLALYLPRWLGPEVYLLDLETARELNPLKIAALPTAMAFSPDGKQLVLADWGTKDKSISFWDTVTAQKFQVLEGGPYGAVAFSPDGRIVAAAEKQNGGA